MKVSIIGLGKVGSSLTFVLSLRNKSRDSLATYRNTSVACHRTGSGKRSGAIGKCQHGRSHDYSMGKEDLETMKLLKVDVLALAWGMAPTTNVHMLYPVYSPMSRPFGLANPFRQSNKQSRVA